MILFTVYVLIIFGKLGNVEAVETITVNDETCSEEEPCCKDINGVQKFATFCYYTDWSYSREKIGAYTPSNIDPQYCDYILFAFVLLEPVHKKSIIPAEPEKDPDFYKKVTALKSKNKKVILALGGFNDSLKEKYQPMLTDPDLRNAVAVQATSYIIEHNFDGLEVAINYPAAYQGDISSGTEADKNGFTEFLKALRNEFDSRTDELKKRLTLSVAVSANEKIVDVAYDVTEIVKLCDWIDVMTLDLHGQWDEFTGLNAPFQKQPLDEGDNLAFNMKSVMEMWLRKGAPACKLVPTIPTYGRSFSLKDSTNTGIHAPTDDVLPKPGEYTKEGGMLAFYEIEENVRLHGWTVKHEKYLGSYAYSSDKQWVGFDDKFDVAVKAEYVRLNCFYGAIIWAIDLDSFQQSSKCYKYPLVSTIFNILSGKESFCEVENCL